MFQIDLMQIESWLREDGVRDNYFYEKSLPAEKAAGTIYIKDELVLSGLPVFTQIFDVLENKKNSWDVLYEFEGRVCRPGDVIELPANLSFATLLNGERLALNLLQRCSSISTLTKKMVELAESKNIRILDTRKTTPGLRSLEKYGVRVGGGFNHRFKQNDVWMVKDNHKSFFGGLTKAVEYFKSMQTFYTPIVVEVHSLEELEEAKKLNINHIMLDNFSLAELKKAIDVKKEGMTYEVSGGVNFDNLSQYLISGVDAISSGSLTHSVPQVDISFKYTKL